MRRAEAALTIVRGPLGPRSLESGLRSKDSRAVRRGAGGKGAMLPRPRPTLRHVRFLGGCDPFSRNLERSKGMGGAGESHLRSLDVRVGADTCPIPTPVVDWRRLHPHAVA
jgi:hypothetical protein